MAVTGRGTSENRLHPCARLMLALMLPLMMTACARPNITGISSSAACVVWQPLDYSFKNDTRETVVGIAINNAKREALCGEKK